MPAGSGQNIYGALLCGGYICYVLYWHVIGLSGTVIEWRVRGRSVSDRCMPCRTGTRGGHCAPIKTRLSRVMLHAARTHRIALRASHLLELTYRCIVTLFFPHVID